MKRLIHVAGLCVTVIVGIAWSRGATATLALPPPTGTATATPTATATTGPTCVTFRLGVCCTSREGTNCSTTVCTADTNCTSAPFLTCGGLSLDDGRVNRANSTVYPPNTTVAPDSTFILTGTQRALWSGPSYAVQNGLVRFNTGPTLPDTATVTSATLIVQVVEAPQSVDGLRLTGEWYNWGPTVGAEDFAQNAASSAFSVPISSLGIGSNTMALAAPAGNVSLTGYTYLRTHISQRPGDAAPTGVNIVKLALFDHPTLAGPALQVCYSVPGPTPPGETTVTFATGVCCTTDVGTNCEDTDGVTPGIQYHVCAGTADCSAPAYPICAGNGNNDGQTESQYSPTYPPAFAQCETNTLNFFAARSRRADGTYHIRNGLLQFDTASTLPDDAVIDSATLRLHTFKDAEVDNLDLVGEWYDWGGTCDASDYTKDAVATAFSVPTAFIVHAADNDFSLLSPENIKTTGTTPTRLRLHLSNIPVDAPPTGLNTVAMSAYEAFLPAEPGPRLTVAYHRP